MRSRVAVVLAVVGLSAALPARALADDEKKPDKLADAEASSLDSGYPPFATRFKVLSAGLLVSGSAWGVSYAAARGWPEAVCHITVAGAYNAQNQPCVSGPPGSAQLGIPIVGPWIALGKSGCASDEPSCPGWTIGLRTAAFIVDGVVQAAGLGLIAEAIIMKTEPFDGAKKTSAFALKVNGVELHPVPLVTPTVSGVAVGGTF